MTDSAPVFRLDLAAFTPLVGHALMADCDPQAVALHLVEASPLTNHARLDRPPFVLIFRSEPDVVLLAGSYVLRASGSDSGRGVGSDVDSDSGADLVSAPIDIGRIAHPSGSEPGHYYQAVFN